MKSDVTLTTQVLSLLGLQDVLMQERLCAMSRMTARDRIAYFLLSGRPPFAECDPESMFALILSEHPIQIATHRGESFPNDVDQFVAKCMAKNSADRFACMQDVTDALDRMIAFYPWGPAEAKQWWKTHGEESV